MLRDARNCALLRACEAIRFVGRGRSGFVHLALNGEVVHLSCGKIDEAVALEDVVGESKHAQHRLPHNKYFPSK